MNEKIELCGVLFLNLIYYLPENKEGIATASVAYNILLQLTMCKKNMPFDKILVVTDKCNQDIKRIQDNSNIDVDLLNNFNEISKNDIIHIPVSPIIIPNRKLSLYMFSILKKSKLIINYHGDFRTEFKFDYKYKHVSNFFQLPTYFMWPYILKSADKLVVNSKIMSDSVKSDYGVQNDVIIPNGIENFWFCKNDFAKLEIDGDPKIFYHGRLVPQKGVHLLIKAFSEITPEYPKAKLYIAGVGPQKADLEKLCTKLNLDKNVFFLGFIDNLTEYLVSMDAAIYPSLYEPFSIAILEAFSLINGPVYYSNLAGINNFILKEGYNLSAFSPTIDNIKTIIHNICMGAYEIELIHHQNDFAKLFTWEKVIDKYIKMYETF